MTEPLAKVAMNSKRGSSKGERRGGRVKGTPNKATASVKEIARQYTDKAFAALVGVLDGDETPPAAKVAAAKEILDRGYGKATTVLAGDGDDGPISIVTRIEMVGVAPK